MPGPKSTKIIATLGPASSSLDTVRALIRAGADCFRINFSHGDASSMQPVIDTVREAATAEARNITVLADIQGPKLRIGRLPAQGVLLVEGAPFLLTSREIEGNERQVHSQYAHIAKDLEPGARVLFADGAVELVVERIQGEDVQCRVVAGGRLFSNKGLNLPGRPLSVQTLTEKIAGTSLTSPAPTSASWQSRSCARSGSGIRARVHRRAQAAGDGQARATRGAASARRESWRRPMA